MAFSFALSTEVLGSALASCPPGHLGELAGLALGLTGQTLILQVLQKKSQTPAPHPRQVGLIIAKERAAIAEQLHDDLVPVLTGSALKCRRLEGDLRLADHPGAAEAGNIARALTQAIGDTREIARNLGVTVSGDCDLAAELQALAARTQEVRDIACEFVTDCHLLTISSADGAEWTALASQAIENALEHAGARKIILELHHTPAGVRMVVQDDGGGLPSGACVGATRGLGMRLMRLRACRLGAALSLEKAPEGGTRVVVTAGAQSPACLILRAWRALSAGHSKRSRSPQNSSLHNDLRV